MHGAHGPFETEHIQNDGKYVHVKGTTKNVNIFKSIQTTFFQSLLPVVHYTLREESSQTNVILQYKLLPSILSAVCSVIQ